jgi:hypothetical protein
VTINGLGKRVKEFGSNEGFRKMQELFLLRLHLLQGVTVRHSYLSP